MTRHVGCVKRNVAVTLLGALVMAAVLGGTTQAQTSNPLDVILAAVSALQNSVNALQASVNLLLVEPEQANVRITPPVLTRDSQEVACSVINASAGQRTVRVQIFSGLAVLHGGTVTLFQLGRQAEFVAPVPPGDATVHCLFTATDGTRADIRGLLQLRTIGSQEPGLVLAAE